MPEPVQEQVSNLPDVAIHKVQKLAPNDMAVASYQHANGGDPDAQAMVIGSLRSQIQDLFSQVTQLNTKLVQSYDRVSDLEDNLHVASSNVRQSSVKISQLELERTQHLAALNTGLLVEKSHVTAELTRLMEKATEEAAQRGQAETARADIEKDLDDLSATLFDQANTMVAEARFARAQSERKVEDAERALKGAEEAVAMMQQQMQEMQTEKERSANDAEEIRALMGKGKWIERVHGSSSPTMRLRSSHTPYQEFLLFVAHLRNIRPTCTNPPAMSTLLALPFLTRLVNEDSEPTVRLDFAPSLNWLSRRTVLSAIHTSQLTIEPMSSTNLLQEFASAQISNTNTSICCGLCGTPIFPNDGDSPPHNSKPLGHPLSLSLSRTSSSINSISRSANLLFKNSRSYSATTSANSSPPISPRRSDFGSSPPQQQVYIFRLASNGSSTSNLGVAMLPASLSPSHSAPTTSTSSQSAHNHSQISAQQHSRNSQTTIYPLCTSGWCLTRLRSTCSLWAFVRTGVIEKVWEEEMPGASTDRYSWSDAAGKPPVPPRRRGLWGMASALGERAASWSEGDKEKRRASTSDREVERKLPSPPPIHPVNATPPRRRLPPPLPPQLPPPLPKRAEGRGRNRPATVSRATSPIPDPKAAEEDLAPIANGHVPTDDTEHSSTEKAEEDVPSSPAEMSNEAPENKAEAHTDPVPEGEQSDADKTVSVPDVTSPLSSPITDKRKSQDSFTSAASEIASSEAASASDPTRPTAEEAVTPPPTSPKVPAINLPSTPTQVKPSAFTEAPSVAALHSDVTKDVPLRTGSPAPPPLPRRAAARARPSSFIPPAPPTAPAPENVPESAGNETKDTSITLVVPEATKEAIADSHIAASESTELSKETIDSSLGSEQSVPENSSEGSKEVAEEPVTYNTVNEKDQADTKSLSAPSSVDDKSSEGPSSPTGTIVGNHINGNIEKNVAAPSQTAEGTDGEAYVGNATWEERTWKELVKLREDMFWARIGALR